MQLTIAKKTTFENLKPRILTLGVVFALLIISKKLMMLGRNMPISHQQIYDIGHHYIPSLDTLFGAKAASWVWWAGSMSIEVAFAAAILTIAFRGKALRLGLALGLAVVLHSLFWHVTILPVPPGITWKFPIPTGQIATPNDFWFSGHVTYAVLLALFAAQQKLWVKCISWFYVLLVIALVLSSRTHYSIDVIGAFFVGYSLYKLLEA